MNKLYQELGRMSNPYGQIMGEINKFASTIKGDPRNMVMQLLNSGEMSQAEFNSLSQTAQQILPFMGMK